MNTGGLSHRSSFTSVRYEVDDDQKVNKLISKLKAEFGSTLCNIVSGNAKLVP